MKNVVRRKTQIICSAKKSCSLEWEPAFSVCLVNGEKIEFFCYTGILHSLKSASEEFFWLSLRLMFGFLISCQLFILLNLKKSVNFVTSFSI